MYSFAFDVGSPFDSCIVTGLNALHVYNNGILTIRYQFRDIECQHTMAIPTEPLMVITDLIIN